MLARFPGNNSEHPASANWAIETSIKIFKDPRFEGPMIWTKSDTPITMVRNQAVRAALEQKVDILIMLDNDMFPDMDAVHRKAPAKFWESSIEFMLNHWEKGPCIIAAPYCGPPPHENVYVFQWGTIASHDPDDGSKFKLQQYSREEAAEMGGIKEAAALPTGLCMFDMRIFSGYKCPDTGVDKKLLPPWFYYEWDDEFATGKASTEDVTMTRDCSLMGIPVYCNWDAWACHIKQKAVGRPHILRPQDVAAVFKETRERGNAKRVTN
jgi:hypothetical protein